VDDRKDAKTLEHALDMLTESLEPSRWIDDSRLQRSRGAGVFDDERRAVSELGKQLEDEKSTIPNDTVEDLIGRLVGADRGLAVVAVEDASGGDVDTLAKAMADLAEGDQRAEEGRPESAIGRYRAAWAHAQETAPVPPGQPPRPAKVAVLAELGALLETTTDTRAAKRLDEATERLARSLDPSRWVDDARLRRDGGDEVFEEERKAVDALLDLLEDGKRAAAVGDAQLDGLIRRLVGADRVLAIVAVAEAGGGDPKKLRKAMDELTKGDHRASLREYAEAIDHYRKAWKVALDAVWSQSVRVDCKISVDTRTTSAR
jgi:hypothetical protein